MVPVKRKSLVTNLDIQTIIYNAYQSIMEINEQIKQLIQLQGITYEDFGKIDKIVESISLELEKGFISREDITKINNTFGQEFIDNTVQGHGLKKPYGYAGDFLMIDKIYTYSKSEIPKYKVWDEYFHTQSAPKAVRNRKEYFKKMVEDRIEKNPELELLNIASGPARDIFEMYSALPKDNKINTTCVEMDENAVEFATKLNKEYLDHITFIRQNIFRHKTEIKYDIIWSAGLFDYFNDKAFLMVLRNFKNWLKPHGEIIIGNFNENNNPSRNYMEIFGEWFLNHRTEDELLSLALNAGFSKDMVFIGKEPENVNLFLHIKN